MGVGWNWGTNVSGSSVQLIYLFWYYFFDNLRQHNSSTPKYAVSCFVGVCGVNGTKMLNINISFPGVHRQSCQGGDITRG